MTEISGSRVIARSLKQQGVDYMFGIVGFPVFGIAAAAQSEGIKYYVRISIDSVRAESINPDFEDTVAIGASISG